MFALQYYTNAIQRINIFGGDHTTLFSGSGVSGLAFDYKLDYDVPFSNSNKVCISFT